MAETKPILEEWQKNGFDPTCLPIEFWVSGTPAPQGSKTAVMPKGFKRPVVIEGKGRGREAHKSWRQAISTAARDWQDEHRQPLLKGPVIVTLLFRLDRPRSKPRWKWLPDVKPDADKLTRSVLDGLSGIVIGDDAQAVRIITEKVYVTDSPPGVQVMIDKIDERSIALSTDDGIPSSTMWL